ncbi:MAG: ABC transporter ATP-binding protein [Hyphomicrobiales bacterium]|nr:ABC transporter ATP-binding protein [Hyphomicrobiales bacterium]
MAKDETAQALTIRDLQKSFGAVRVLTDISLSMVPGDFLVLLGPSGCGKSTLLNCIAGLETITSGQILIAGRDVTEIPPRDRDIAMVFQSYALYPTMTVGENITFGMRVRGTPKAIREERLAEVASILQIGPLIDRKPSQLSGGQRQRVAMGRALVRHPKLFLFDEPLSNLDAKLRVEMRAEIRRLHQTVDASIVYVTHDQIEAMTLATQIVVLRDGLVQQIGSPDEIYDSPANTFVAGFIGSPPMNLIPATVEQREDAAVLVFETEDTDGVTLDIGDRLPREKFAGSRSIVFGVRPEAIGLEGEKPFNLPADLVVSSTEKTGSDQFLISSLGGAGLIARLSAESRVNGGEAVRLSLDPAKAACFDPGDGSLIHSFTDR